MDHGNVTCFKGENMIKFDISSVFTFFTIKATDLNEKYVS
jgi:hypothetical protein